VYKLYWIERTASFAVAALLAELRVEHELIRLSREALKARPPALIAANPQGKLPTLVLPDGSGMSEVGACLWHLAESHPEAEMIPPLGDPARAQHLRWLFYAVVNVYETDLHGSYPERYTDDPDGAAGVRQAAVRRFVEHWQPLAALLEPGPFLRGDRLSALDLLLANIVIWQPGCPSLASRGGPAKRLAEAVAARPRIATLWELFEMDGLVK